ncbi:MAG: GtrA family protein [Lachnospiraceae bacterium]|nr:GtrA family protein [Lachnospiraceae bacterium]
MERILDLIKKYKKSLSYIAVSLVTAGIETIIGLLVLNLLGYNEVVSNTAGIIVGSLIHYLLVTRKVFDKSVGYKTVLIYISTFFLGVLIQDTVVGFASSFLKKMIDTNLSYVISKFCSLAVSFVINYHIRKFLYSKVE